MATRCNIQISDKDTSLWIYRHWDGYPERTGEELRKFIKNLLPESANELADFLTGASGSPYRYTECQHGDIEYLYQIYIGDFDVVMHIIHLPLVMKLDGEVVHERKTIKTEIFSR